MNAESVAAKVHEKGAKLVVVVDDVEKPVGAAVVRVLEKNVAYEISLMGTKEAMRNKNVGTRLIDKIKEIATSVNREAYVFVNALIGSKYFYKRQDFISVLEVKENLKKYVELLSGSGRVTKLVWQQDKTEYSIG